MSKNSKKSRRQIKVPLVPIENRASSDATKDDVKEYLHHKAFQLAAFGWDSFQSVGRGAIVISWHYSDVVEGGTTVLYVDLEGLSEEYLDSDFLPQVVAYVLTYDPATEIVVWIDDKGQDYLFRIPTLISPPDASDVRMMMIEDQVHVVGNTDLLYYDDLIEFAYAVTFAAQDDIAKKNDDRLEDIQHLATKLLSHASTLSGLTQNHNMLVQRIPQGDQVVDFPSVIVIARTVLESYVSMFEVFFEPSDDDEFEFQHALWQLAGYVFAEDYPVDDPSIQRQSQLAKNAAEDARNRLKATKVFSTKSVGAKRDALKGRRAGRDWESVARKAGFGEVHLKKVYKQYSGYAHSDGLSGQTFMFADREQINAFLDVVMYMSMACVSKMILGYAAKFPSVLRFCQQAETMYDFTERISQTFKSLG